MKIKNVLLFAAGALLAAPAFAAVDGFSRASVGSAFRLPHRGGHPSPLRLIAQ